MVSITNHNVQCAGCGEVVEPTGPEHRLLLGVIFSLAFGLLGLGIGTTIGIATAGFGIAATIPLSLLGLYFGWKLGGWIAALLDGVHCPDCGHEFGKSSVSTMTAKLPF